MQSIKRISDVVIFRADAGTDIGYGHVMRCLSLAHALREVKIRCVFVSCDNVPGEVITRNGFEFVALNTDQEEMLSELEKVERIIKKLSPRFLVVDSYRVSRVYMQAMRGLAPLVYIDDVKSFPYPCDVLVNYNIYGEEWAKDYLRDQAPFETKLLLGLKYAPLREEFAFCPPRTVRKSAKNILVSTGGADTQDVSRKILTIIQKMPQWEGIHFHFLVGALNPYKQQIETMASEMENVKLHFQTKRVSDLMQMCDMAVSAAGSTLYELCACGIPTVTYILADNQIPGAKAFAKQKLMLFAGDCRGEGFDQKLTGCLQQLIASWELRADLSERMQSKVDGKGARRLARNLIEA